MSLNDIENIFKKDLDEEEEKLVFVHPDDRGNRDYSDKEYEMVTSRPFESRFFFSAKNVGGNTVWLRTHHTDNATYDSYYLNLRDLFKAACSLQDHTAAKVCLAEILSAYFSMDTYDCRTAACTIASALSEEGKNLDFQIHHTMLKDKSDRVN